MAGGRGAVTPVLMPPTTEYRMSFLAALAEFQAEGGYPELIAARLSEPDDFARYVAALRAGVDRPGEPAFFLSALNGGRAPDPPAGGYVPQTTLWWVAGDEYLGTVRIRHRLTDRLRCEGGNIGYDVRPSARRNGHASAMLRAALPLAASFGIDPALVTCDAPNIASRLVIERAGGALQDEVDGVLRFFVPTE